MPEPFKRFVVEYTLGPQAGLFAIVGLMLCDVADLPAQTDGCTLVKVTPRYVLYRQDQTVMEVPE